MLIFPAIDLFEGKAVRLLKGDYAQMTVYSGHPEEVAADFAAQGASCLHVVDLEGARSGQTPNFGAVCRLIKAAPLFCQVGGGIRTMDSVDRYLGAGASRVILGTAAACEKGFVEQAAKKHGAKIAVGVDIRNGFVAVNGWTENSGLEAFEFCRQMQNSGIQTLICTDISKDGAMQGANLALYGELSSRLGVDIVASGGVSTLEDVKRLKQLGLYGAIIGKAYYTGAISLSSAIEEAR